MRLLHTKNLEFQEFYDMQIPKYAILSHRWIGNEVSYAEFHDRKARKRPEFSKVLNFCSLAKRHEIEWVGDCRSSLPHAPSPWITCLVLRIMHHESLNSLHSSLRMTTLTECHEQVWIDTCCIDKKSSAELTEAINSMYQWYERAKICYAYLADVRMVEDEHENWEKSRAEFHRSAWFTRGWTLQELLAPAQVLFYDRNWAVIGAKLGGYINPKAPADGTRKLNEDISSVTEIKEDDLREPQYACVARKFSWLSRRETTRVEDMAYCMLGLCNVNMPLLYGEGEKAFLRLQMEIIKSSDDESIFAWFNDSTFGYGPPILASHPRYFARSGSITLPDIGLRLPGKMPFSMTNKGLQYQVPRAGHQHDSNKRNGEDYVLLLDCCAEDESGRLDNSGMITITLKYDGPTWWRYKANRMELSHKNLWTDIVESPGCIYETLYIYA